MTQTAESLFYFDKRLIHSLHADHKKITLVGIDEAGRGPLAGPVVASAVILNPDFFDPQLNDSKKVSPPVRQKVFEKLVKNSFWSIGTSSVTTIDSKNILQATYDAMRSALNNLVRQNPQIKPDLVIIDGRAVPDMGFLQKSIIKGDQKSAAIASASIIAKVWRDRMMMALDRFYPQYGFSQHKGYGTKLHQKNLSEFGPSPHHRRSFAPVRKQLIFSETD